MANKLPLPIITMITNIITCCMFVFSSNYCDENAKVTHLFRILDQSRLSAGNYTGAYRLQLNDGRINWYFSNLALLPLCDRRPKDVETYLDLYLRSVSPTSGTISDVRDFSSCVEQPPDSHDSYAATLLSLAVRYRQSNHNPGWWVANRAKLKKIGRKVLLESQKPTGLVKVFVADENRTVGYLMDNCEVYRGLADFAKVLIEENDPDAKDFSEAATRVASGVAGLFDERIGAFRVADIDAAATFYPLRAAQIFPEVFSVPLGDPVQTRRRYDAAWNYLNATGDRWERGKVKDGSFGHYPWMILGYAAAKRGEFDLAETQLKFFRKELKSPVPSPTFTAIHELGWAIQTQELINAHQR